MVTLTITIPDDIYERLKAVTEESATTVDDTISSLLDDALPCVAMPVRSQAEIEDERRRVREALKDISTEFDGDEFLRALGIRRMGTDERRKILETLPEFDPPLSQIIIEDREDRI